MMQDYVRLMEIVLSFFLGLVGELVNVILKDSKEAGRVNVWCAVG